MVKDLNPTDILNSVDMTDMANDVKLPEKPDLSHAQPHVQESVLCIPRANLPDQWLGKRTALKMNEQLFFNTCSSAGFQWIERCAAESDPSLKQIIPYIVIKTRAGSFSGSGSSPSIAMYRRKGSEKRLHDLYSMGIGGHINPMDASCRSSREPMPFKDLVMAGMKRELCEELLQRPREDRPVFQGIINEEMTDVGKVHLGALFVIVTDSPGAFVPGSELAAFQWMEREELSKLNLELWSTMALQMI